MSIIHHDQETQQPEPRDPSSVEQLGATATTAASDPVPPQLTPEQVTAIQAAIQAENEQLRNDARRSHTGRNIGIGVGITAVVAGGITGTVLALHGSSSEAGQAKPNLTPLPGTTLSSGASVDQSGINRDTNTAVIVAPPQPSANETAPTPSEQEPTTASDEPTTTPTNESAPTAEVPTALQKYVVDENAPSFSWINYAKDIGMAPSPLTAQEAQTEESYRLDTSGASHAVEMAQYFTETQGENVTNFARAYVATALADGGTVSPSLKTALVKNIASYFTEFADQYTQDPSHYPFINDLMNALDQVVKKGVSSDISIRIDGFGMNASGLDIKTDNPNQMASQVDIISSNSKWSGYLRMNNYTLINDSLYCA